MLNAESRPRLRVVVGLLVLLFAGSSAANAAVFLLLDIPSISGLPGDTFTISGTVTNSSSTLTELLVSLDPAILTSPVLEVTGLHAPSLLDVDETYVGDVVTFAILAVAAPGSYPTNTFGLSYGSINGRTFLSNTVNLDVTVEESAEVPEPGTPATVAGGLALLGCIWLVGRKGSRYCRRTALR